MTILRRCTNEDYKPEACAACGGRGHVTLKGGRRARCSECAGIGTVNMPCPEVGITVQIQTERDSTGTYAKNDADLNCRTCGKPLSDD